MLGPIYWPVDKKFARMEGGVCVWEREWERGEILSFSDMKTILDFNCQPLHDNSKHHEDENVLCICGLRYLRMFSLLHRISPVFQPTGHTFLCSSSSSLCWAADWHQRAHQWPGQSWHPSFGLQDVRHEGPLPWHWGSSCPQRAGGKRRECQGARQRDSREQEMQ